MAFAGLARPAVFAATLQELGADLKGFQIFPDHHPYSQEELDRLTDSGPVPGRRGPGHHRQGLGPAGRALGRGRPPVGPGSGGPAGRT